MTATMRAAVAHGPADVRIERVARPEPAAGEVLIEVAAAGICGTDAHIYRQGAPMFPGHPDTRWPLVLGHEFAGRIVETGSGAGALAIGDVVVSGAGVSCGECRLCSAGRTNLCERYWTLGIHRHGGMAEYCAAPASSCRLVELGGMSDDTAALAQPMAVAEHAVARGRLGPGERALLIGAGGIGMFAVWAAAQRGAKLTVCDRDPGRLAIAASLGADRLVEIEAGRPFAEQLAELGPWDAIYEMSGRPEPLREAITLAAAGGRIVVVGLQPEPQPIDARRLAIEEVELIGTVAHVCATDLPAAVRLLAARAGGWGDLASDPIPLEDLVEAGLRPLAEGRPAHVKTLIDPRTEAQRPFQARRFPEQAR